MGARPGDRIATLAWNGYRHVELYYAVAGSGMVMHTVNPRLFPEQIAWILNDAEDAILFIDLTFVPLVRAVRPQCKHLKQVVLMTDRAHMPADCADMLCFEELVEAQTDAFEWPELDENSRAALLHLRTTGNPKGALFSHRSSVLHAYGPACRMRCACRRATASFRSCRCSTPTRGACPSPRR